MTCDCPHIESEISFYTSAVSYDTTQETYWHNQKMYDSTQLSYWQSQAAMCGCSSMLAAGQKKPTDAGIDALKKKIQYLGKALISSCGDPLLKKKTEDMVAADKIRRAKANAERLSKSTP